MSCGDINTTSILSYFSESFIEVLNDLSSLPAQFWRIVLLGISDILSQSLDRAIQSSLLRLLIKQAKFLFVKMTIGMINHMLVDNKRR